jgi:cell division protein FtsA
MGGVHITNDLAIGLKTDLDIAEEVKIAHGSIEQEVPTDTVKVTYNDEMFEFDASDVRIIIESRMDEIFEYVEKELRKVGKSQKLPGGVVITGGTANLRGVAEFAKNKLQLAARVGSIEQVNGLLDTISSPDYASAVGLMMLDMYLGPDDGLESGEPNNGFFGFLEGFFGQQKKR